MNSSQQRFTRRSGKTWAMACLLAGLTGLPQAAFSADPDPQSDRAEQRIKSLHAQLKITEAQEGAWSTVAQVMRDDAKAMDGLTQARHDHAQTMTAVDDLKSYSEVTDAHAQGLHKLTDAFTPLYASFSDAQRKEADQVFRNAAHHAMAHKTAGAR